MKLRYDNSISSDPAPLVLTNPEGRRVEIHIRAEPDATATLIALGGRTEGEPEKTSLQGPFELYDQAVAAKRAIAAQLRDAGYTPAEDEYPRWSMAVQRAINEVRHQRQAAAIDYRFDPKDVFLDW